MTPSHPPSTGSSHSISYRTRYASSPLGRCEARSPSRRNREGPRPNVRAGRTGAFGGHLAGAARSTGAVGGLHRAGDVDPGVGVELAEHVANVGLDGLLAEKQLAGDLGVGLAIDDQLRDLELATR